MYPHDTVIANRRVLDTRDSVVSAPGRKTQVWEEMNALESAVERLDALACKLQPLIPPGPFACNGAVQNEASAPLAPLAQQLRALAEKVATVNQALERIEL